VKLALGTVQFGLAYGAFNAGGAVEQEEAGRCLSLAAAAGVDLLDTARAYGHSEQVLGDLKAPETFRIVTKTPALATGARGSAVTDALGESLAALGVERVYGLMLHRGTNLLRPDGDDIWSALARAKGEGEAEKIGVSVYSPEEASAVVDRFPIEILQAPFSAFDQRMRTTGTFQRLKDKGVEIHVRSIFLQGFALADPERLPPHLSPWRGVLERFRAHAEDRGMTPLRLALAVAEQEDAIDRIVIGVQSARDLQEILESMKAPAARVDAEALAHEDAGLINPSNWKAAA
jgi:aryl-alcohol dehydrogenase-like predicted oxidoreductase